MGSTDQKVWVALYYHRLPGYIVSIVGSLRDREVACSASDRQGSNFESCVWRTVSSQSSHHPQEVLLAQFSLYVHKGGLKPDSFHYLVTCMPHTRRVWFWQGGRPTLEPPRFWLKPHILKYEFGILQKPWPLARLNEQIKLWIFFNHRHQWRGGGTNHVAYISRKCYLRLYLH